MGTNVLLCLLFKRLMEPRWVKTAQLISYFLLCTVANRNLRTFGFLFLRRVTFFHSSPHSPVDQRAYIPAFDIQSLLPQDLGRYYRYNGSLTTPPCYQSVIWTLFHERVQISKAQVKLTYGEEDSP